MPSAPEVNKCPVEYDSYRPVDSALHRQIARDELHEEPAIVEQALRQMREWIAKNPSILASRTDASFLLRFLRVRKFSHVAACDTLERFLIMRQRFPAWYGNLDPSEPWVQDVIDSEFLLPLGRDDKGRTVFLMRYANLDIDQHDVVRQIRFFTMVFECLFEDALCSIGGLVLFSDHSHVPMKAFAQWSLTEIRNYIDCVTKSHPIRMKEVHVMNLPLFGATVGEWVMSCCSEKLRSRLKCYPSVDDFVRKTDLKAMLPTAYGGKQDAAKLKQNLRDMLDRNRHIIVGLDAMKVDEKRATASHHPCNRADLDTGVVGSFRKLNLD
ncbi:clavesin-2-like [Anopheles ziemanni]|uniref:clavesin-2-like n=1 Tax=Anopheles coustani TaxID=139045 RepID=UPI00265ADA0C|nr:clavesin-2-like [Anopheles coustani]XP_058178529.1 clavesin-2-like [Anopheles ziemanni]